MFKINNAIRTCNCRLGGFLESKKGLRDVFAGYNHFKKLLKFTNFTEILHSQLTFTCSKSTIETLEKGVKYFQS